MTLRERSFQDRSDPGTGGHLQTEPLSYRGCAAVAVAENLDTEPRLR